MTNTNKDSRGRRQKCLAYIVAGVIAQTIIIVLFVLLVMRIRNLKVRIDSVSVESLTYTNSSFSVKLNAEISVKNTSFGEFKFDDSTATISYHGTKVEEFIIIKSRAKFRSTERFNVTVSLTYTNSSFSVKLNAEISVKNTNFGEFKFDDSTATLSYNGTKVGEFTIIKSRAKFRSTERFNVTVTATSAKVSTKSLLASDLNSGKLPLTSYAKLSGKVHLLMIFKKKKSAELSCSMAVNTKSQAIENLTCK